jgi:tetratricopeptide (TPR) repeat protein
MKPILMKGWPICRLRSFPKAKTAFNKCYETNNDGVKASEALINLGVIELMNSNFSGAVNVYGKLLIKEPTNTNALFNRAIAYGELKNHEKAIEDLTQCITLGRTDADVYFARGVQYINLFDYAIGCSDLQTAVDAGHEKAKELWKAYCENNSLVQ